MARRRMIAPDIWDSESFGALSILGKLLWIGMISIADDEGIGRAQPSYLKSRLLPYDELRVADVDKALLEVSHKMSVTLYEVEGSKLYRLDNWNTWQTINKPTRSKFPAPPAKADGVGGDLCPETQLPNDSSSTTVVLHDDYRLKEKEIEIEIEDEREVNSAQARACTSDTSSMIRQVIDYLNQRCGTAYRYRSETSKRHISARLKEGYTLEDFKAVIDKKASEWQGTELEKFLRPETLFGSKFESYLNAKINSNNRPKSESFSQERHYSKEEMDKIWPVATAEDYKAILD